MAKSTTPRKGATKKVASKEENIIEMLPAEAQPVAPEPKKVKRVSIAKPKALIEKNVKKDSVSAEVKTEIVESNPIKPKKITKKSPVKTEVAIEEPRELPIKPVKEKGKAVKKTKNKQSEIIPPIIEAPMQEEQTVTVDSQSANSEQAESGIEKGEEKLSRKERRLREWKERKKLKRLQHLQEKQQSRNEIEKGDLEQDQVIVTADQPVLESSQEVAEIPTQVEKLQHGKVKKQQPKQETSEPFVQQKNQDQHSKVLPLDKVGRDFPPLKKVETWGNAMSKAKVDPLPKQLEPLLQKTIHFLEQEIRIKKPSVILVGVSGGIDSVVLLDILSVISTRGWCTIHVAHCNHQLRGEASHQDELFVRRLASSYGLHFHHTSADVTGYSNEYNLGIEVAARIMRYQFFEKAAKACHADVIATAHHSEDNAETLLMNLMRGSGITGLAGIPPRRDLDKKLSYIRPILWLSKKEIEHYAKVRNLEWREDESNTSMNFTRNKIRHELLPMLRAEYSPGLTEVLNRTTTLMREAQEFIAERIIHIMKQGVREISKSSFAINLGMFQTIKDFAKGELIQASLRQYLRMQPISMVAIDSVLNLSQGPAGGRLDISKDLFVLRDREELVFARPEQAVEIFMPVMKLGNFTSSGIGYHAEIADPRSVAFGEHPLIEYFDADVFPEQCVIRHWRDGDRITPIGLDGSMTVSDFLTNSKIPVADKRKVLVLCSGDEVLWIIGYRIHNGYKVTQHTTSIMRISITLDKHINYLQPHSQKQLPKSQQKPKQKAQHKPQHHKNTTEQSPKAAIEQVEVIVQEPVNASIEKKSKRVKSNPRAPKKPSASRKDA